MMYAFPQRVTKMAKYPDLQIIRGPAGPADNVSSTFSVWTRGYRMRKQLIK